MTLVIEYGQFMNYLSAVSALTTNKTLHYIQVCSEGGVIIHPYHFQGEYPNEIFARTVGDAFVRRTFINHEIVLYNWEEHPECNACFAHFKGEELKGSAMIFRLKGVENTGIPPTELVKLFDSLQFNPFYKYALTGVIL